LSFYYATEIFSACRTPESLKSTKKDRLLGLVPGAGNNCHNDMLIDQFNYEICSLMIHSPFLFDPIRCMTFFCTIDAKALFIVASEHPRISAIPALVSVGSCRRSSRIFFSLSLSSALFIGSFIGSLPHPFPVLSPHFQLECAGCLLSCYARMQILT